MSNEVMVALDGSEKEGRALAVGLGLAAIARTQVHLLRVIEPPFDRSDVEGRVTEAARRLKAEAELPITWEVIEGKDVAGELIRYGTARGALLVVMGTRAPRSVGLALAGSVADRVVRECPVPAVLVPPGAFYMEGKRVRFRRVVVPLDGSTLAERSVDYLLGLPGAREVEFVLVGVARAADTITYAHRQLHLVAERVRARGAAAEARVIESDNPVQGIAGAVREFLVEMIAMSTRGAGGLERLVLGSVAAGVVRAAEVPVLLLTPTMLAKGDASR